MHEFAHGVQLIAARTAIRGWQRRLEASFNAARRRGLWSNTYANTNNIEYFAEGKQFSAAALIFPFYQMI